MTLDNLGLTRQKLAQVAAYLLFAQFLLFVGFTIALLANSQFFVPASAVVIADFLTELGTNSIGFFIAKSILLALRTCYSLSFIFIAILFWKKAPIASAAVASSMLLSVAIINVAQLMGIALIPIAQEYAAALSQSDQIRMAVLEASAFGIFAVQDYLDLFVNAVTFNIFFVGLFGILNHEERLKNVKWLIPIMMILPFNRFFELPGLVSGGAGLTNVIVTAIFFLLLGRFFLNMASTE
ncbi:MAG: hypothetical protein AAF702_45400 [Chloroflexota bacterium]